MAIDDRTAVKSMTQFNQLLNISIGISTNGFLRNQKSS